MANKSTFKRTFKLIWLITEGGYHLTNKGVTRYLISKDDIVTDDEWIVFVNYPRCFPRGGLVRRKFTVK